jgi:hypothetical protein
VPSPKDCWVEANIFIKPKSKYVLPAFVKPLIQNLKKNFEVKSWHFFQEPNYEIRFRVLTTTKDSEHIKDVLMLLPSDKKISKFVKKIEFTDYNGESKLFGKDGWPIAFRMFEVNSDWALAYNDPTVKKGVRFRLADFNHFLLNVNNFGVEEEIEVLAYMIKERALMMAQIYSVR